ETGKIDLGDELFVGNQAVCRLRQRMGKKLPWKEGAICEQWIWNAIGGNVCKAAEEYAEYNHSEEGLKNCPGCAQGGLLIANLEDTPHEKPEQFPVLPQGPKVERNPAAGGRHADYRNRSCWRSAGELHCMTAQATLQARVRVSDNSA